MFPVLVLGSWSRVQFTQGHMCRCDEEGLGAQPKEPHAPGRHSEADRQHPEAVAAAPRWGGWSQKPPAGSSPHQTGKRVLLGCLVGGIWMWLSSAPCSHMEGNRGRKAFTCWSTKRSWAMKSQTSCKPDKQEIWAAGSCSKGRNASRNNSHDSASAEPF